VSSYLHCSFVELRPPSVDRGRQLPKKYAREH
jgi:hypothetical protein